MNKEDFLDKLKEDLPELSDEERQNGLKYFDEYFGESNEANKDTNATSDTNESAENCENIEYTGEQGGGAAEINEIISPENSEVRQGDWIYFNDADGIFKKRAQDGGAKTKLSDKRGHNITPAGEWVFYISENVIYKTRADGAITMPVTTGNTTIKQIIGATNKWVYFLNCKEDGPKDTDIMLYVINTNGKHHASLENNIKSAVSINKWLFYSKLDGGLYRIEISKGNKSQKTCQKLCEDRVDGLSIKGSLIKWVHYNNLSDNGKTYKIRIDGSQRQVVE